MRKKCPPSLAGHFFMSLSNYSKIKWLPSTVKRK